MKNFFFSLLTLLSLSVSAQAVEGLRLQAYLYNPEFRYERAEDQSLTARKPYNYAAAVRKGMYSGMFEYSTFKTASGNSSLNVTREHQDYMLWGRLHFFTEDLPTNSFSLYFGAGAGTYQETVITSLAGTLVTDTGARVLETGLSFGGDNVFLLQKDFGLIVGIETRLLFGKDFDPNPEFSGLLRFGIQF